MAFTPFSVTWHLCQPVCLSERPLHLDALLAWAKVKQALEQQIPPQEALQAQEDLPLEPAEKEGQTIWKASALIFQYRSRPFLVPMTRKTSSDEIAFARKDLVKTTKNSITQGTGPYKDFDLRITCQWVEKVEAYGIGDADLVQTLLNRVLSLGRLTRNGWGTISSFQIAPCSEAQEKWRYRTLPAVFKPTKLHYAGTGSIRPPYWERQQWQPVWEFAGV
jgi:CRISPR type IV-associated protein Csf3